MPNRKIEKKFADAIRNAYRNESALLIGNGINRVNLAGLSWEDLLKNLIERSEVKNVRIGNKPLTFLFEEISHKMKDGATRSNVKQLKKIVRDLIAAKLSPGNIHKKFVSLTVQNILTTNYDYCLEKALDENFTKKNDNLRLKEKKYSLTRYNKVNDKCIWHIHGELNNGVLVDVESEYPEQSIMLGFDQYIGYISRILQYFEAEHYNEKSIVANALQELSSTNPDKWISFFFTHNVHIVGLDLGLFETHIWWLLNFRAAFSARQNCINNKIVYYVPSYELLLKRDQLEMLESLKVDIKEVSCAFNNGNFYEDFYEEVYQILKKEFNVN